MSLLGLYKKYREVISYLFWGACTTVINIATYWLCFSILNIPNVPSTIISWVVAVAFAYITNRIFVFRSKSEKIFSEISKFVSARLLTGIFDIAIMFFAVDVMNWAPLIWKVVSNIIVIILNFVFSKWFVFTDTPKKVFRKRRINAKVVITWLLIIVDAAILIFGFNWSKTAITYLEHSPSSTISSSSVVISENEQFSQEISMPYGIFNSISIAIDDLGRTSNSTYNIQIQDSSNKVIMDTDFIPSKLPEDKILRLSGKSNKSISREETYRLIISAKDVTEETKVGFFKDEGSDRIHYDVYGGEYRFWWTGFVLFISFYISTLLCRALCLLRNDKKLLEDRLFKALLLFGVIFALASVFSVGGYFTDEYDNMQGGIAISDGSVLYRDYVTQHTPFTYYLCAFFHSLGAESITQFRLMFYILFAIVWALIYLRYSKFFNGKRIVLLSIAITCILTCAFNATNLELLYDNVQMMCFIALMFEFIAYCKDKNPDLGWTRSIIVSLSIFISVGAAFNSLFPLVAFGIGFLVAEIKYWLSHHINLSEFIKRYYRLAIALIVLAVIIVAYFWFNSALDDAYNQAYLFNTQVYSNYYMGGYGSNVLEPFVLGFSNFFNAIKDIAVNLFRSKFDFTAVFFAITIVVTIYTIFRQWRDKHYLISLIVFLVICFSFSRENFHTISAWAVMIFSCIILFPTIRKRIMEWQWFIIAPITVFLFVPYYEHVRSFVLYEQPTVSELDKKVIDYTEEGGYVGVDSYLHDSLYFHYKGRKVANKNMYVLPWYMVWYEDLMIEDYNRHQPRVLLYDPNTELWGISNYAPRLKEYVNQNYTRDSSFPTLWIKK